MAGKHSQCSSTGIMAQGPPSTQGTVGGKNLEITAIRTKGSTQFSDNKRYSLVRLKEHKADLLV